VFTEPKKQLMMKTKQITIYLSHPTEKRMPSNIIENLKKAFELQSQIIIIDPFKEAKNHKIKDIAQEEINLIKKSDLMLVYLPQPSIGVAMEIFTAMLFHRRIVLIAPPEIQKHPWIQWILKR